MENNNTVRDRHFQQLNAYRELPDYAKIDTYEQRAAFFAGTVGCKWEIDAAIFDEFLNLLPPLGWRGNIFYMCEFLFDDITHKFSREGDRYFCEVATYPPRPAPPGVTVSATPTPKR